LFEKIAKTIEDITKNEKNGKKHWKDWPCVPSFKVNPVLHN
jgi:hypothetical protein